MLSARRIEIAASVVAAIILAGIFVPFQKASAFTVDVSLVNANPNAVPMSAVGSKFLITVNVSPGELISISQIELTLDNGKADVKHTVFDSNGHKISGDPNLTRGNLQITVPSNSTSGYGYGYGYASTGTTFSPPNSYSFTAENASIAGNTYGYTYAVPNANLVNGFVGPAKIMIEGKLNTALMSAGTHTLDVLIHTGAGGNGVDKLASPQLVFTTVKGPPSPPANAANLNVQAVDLFGKPVQGVSTVIKGDSDVVVKSGYTPLAFNGNASASYNVSVSNYDGKTFVKWQDNNSTSSSRTIKLPSGANTTTVLTAVYDTGNSLRGFTPLTYKMPELTVEARTLDGKTALHMYAIIDPQSSDMAAGTVTYKVYPGNFGNTTFDHWDDGSTQAVRTLTIHEDTTISAYYNVR